MNIIIIQFIQQYPIIPFLLLFTINNIVLYKAWCKNKHYKAQELKKIKEEAKTEKRKCTDEELEDEIKPQTSFTWTFCICVCFDIWMLGAFFTHIWAAQYFNEVKEEDCNKALFGDSFGAVNALISAFAFAGMLVAFFLQRYVLMASANLSINISTMVRCNDAAKSALFFSMKSASSFMASRRV